MRQNIAVVYTGTEKEGIEFRAKLPSNNLIFDSTGKLSLDQLMTLIYKSKAIVACSTVLYTYAVFMVLKLLVCFRQENRFIRVGGSLLVLIQNHLFMMKIVRLVEKAISVNV